MKELTVTLPELFPYHGRNLKETKELSKYCEVVGIKEGKAHPVITVRWFMSRSKSASVVYCSMWVYGRGSGSGSASGYGYDKHSSSFEEALESCGINTNSNGNYIEEILIKISELLGYEGSVVVSG